MMSRKSFLPFHLPDVDGSELEYIEEVINSGWLTSGPMVRQFEQEFSDSVGAQYAVAVNSCTAGMHLALEAIGLKSNDEVITSPYTFAATGEVIRYFDAKPVFVDIDKTTFNIDTALIEPAISERTKAILPIHIAGLAVDMDPILNIAKQNKLMVVEDAAHAFPTTYKGKRVGSIGDLACFSFYATKTITTAEGGMVCTNNARWAERCRTMSLHGISKNAWNRYAADGSWQYDIIAPGFKYNMTDIAAAMGLAQLRKSDRMWHRRNQIANQYNSAFISIPEIEIPYFDNENQHAWHLYMVRLNLEMLTINRNQFVKELIDQNIGVSVHFIPLHLHPYYQKSYGYEADDFPVSHQQYKREISLPIYNRMSDEDVRYIVGVVKEIIDRHKR